MQKISVMAFILFVIGNPAFADSGIAGRYLGGGGSDIQVLLTIQSPPPVAFIVLQQIPDDVKILAASPAPSGFQQKGGTVKWLFKRPVAGSVILSLQLSRQVPESQLLGEISYRDPRSGALITKKISR